MKIYRVTINSTSWGDYTAPTAKAARDIAKRDWLASCREPVRSIECFEIED